MNSSKDCTKSITNLFEFHFETPGHEPHYVLLDETAQSLASLKQTVSLDELRRYFGAKDTDVAAFYLSLVAPYFDECAEILLDFANHPDRNIQFDAGSGLLKSARYRSTGIRILTGLVDAYLQGDIDEIYPSKFRELLEEDAAYFEGLDEFKSKVHSMVT